MHFILYATTSFAENTQNCRPGQHWVRAHHRNSYIRSDGTFVSAANVTAHCQNNPAAYDKWHPKLKSNPSERWIRKQEKPRNTESI